MGFQSVSFRSILRATFSVIAAGAMLIPGIVLADHTDYTNDAGVLYRVEPSEGLIVGATYPALQDACGGNDCLALYINDMFFD